MRTWYNFKQTDTDPAVLSIFDDIGAFGVSAKSFLNDLASAQGDSVRVEINSPGGDVFAGLAIYNGLRNSGKKVNVRVLGLAASAASLVAMAGDTIEMPENSFMMVHNPWGFAIGGADDMRDTADMLDKLGASLASTYAKRTGKSAEEITALLDAETWMSAAEAVDAGFATAVISEVPVKAAFDLDRLPANVRAAYASAKASAPAPEPAPAPATAPAPEGDPEASAPMLADAIESQAAAADLSAFAAVFAADASLDTQDKIAARIAEAREINALCKLAGFPEEAAGLIKAKANIPDARAKLLAKLSDSDEIDTAPRLKREPQNQGAQPAAVGTSSIWAARRKQQPGA